MSKEFSNEQKTFFKTLWTEEIVKDFYINTLKNLDETAKSLSSNSGVLLTLTAGFVTIVFGIVPTKLPLYILILPILSIIFFLISILFSIKVIRREEVGFSFASEPQTIEAAWVSLKEAKIENLDYAYLFFYLAMLFLFIFVIGMAHLHQKGVLFKK